jgi:hypothetical protein
MGKKNRRDIEPDTKAGKRGKVPFTFLSLRFDDINKETAQRHIFLLIFASLAAKVLVMFITTAIFHSFIDYFDIGVYLKHAVMLVQGQMPFDAEFGYPILILIPVMIAMGLALVAQSTIVFVYTFQILMVLCDIVTVLCVYFIGLKLWDEKTAFYSGLVYVSAFSAAYFVLTKYDAFPASLLMFAVACTLFRKEIGGYALSITGFFTKVFPILALPLFVLFNAKETSLKQEILTAAKVVIPITVLLFLPLFLIQPETLNIYIPIRSELGYYSNTVTFTLYSWIHDVFGIGITLGMVSAFMYIGMVVGMLTIFYAAYKIPGRDPRLLLKLLLCALILAVVSARVRSPQYILWFTPLICILVMDDIKKIALLFIFQAFAYIEFPLMFGAFYTSTSYTSPLLSTGWFITLIEFTLEYLALFVCIWLVVDPPEIYRKIRGARN